MANKFTYRIIRRIYEACLWKRGDLDGLRVTVNGADGVAHTFHERRLRTYRQSLETMLLTHMPDRLKRSKGCTGLPWYTVRWDKDGVPVGSNEVVAMLVALAVASELMTLTYRRVEGVTEMTAYVVVEDKKMLFRRRVRESSRVSECIGRRKNR